MTREPKTNVEFRVVNTADLPPIVISQNENDEPKVVLNTYHRIWISLNRKLIAGIVDNLTEKIDMMLTGYLQEQRRFEIDDLEMMNDG